MPINVQAITKTTLGCRPLIVTSKFFEIENLYSEKLPNFTVIFTNTGQSIPYTITVST